MQQPGVEQFADHEPHAAGGMEMVHVGLTVRIDPAQQRHHLRQIGEIVPGQLDAAGARHGDQMDGVVGGAAGRVQADDAVDPGAFVQHVRQRGELVAALGDGDGTLRRRAGERVAQWGAGIDEGGTRQVQAHHLHQHLVGVGGAVKRAGAGSVVGLHLGGEQRGAVDLALGVELTDAGFFAVREARGHRPGGDEHGRQMAEGERAHYQAGHDLVADAEIDRRVERLVRERDRGGERDHVAGEQRELHAGFALGYAVAHGRHAAGDLRGGAGVAGGLPDQRRVALIGLMRREHVVVGGDDRQVGSLAGDQPRLVGRAGSGEGVGLVGAPEPATPPAMRRRVDARQVGGAGVAAAFDNAVGDLGDARVQAHAAVLCGLDDSGQPGMARPGGLEPPTRRLEGCCSVQLS